MISAKHKLSDSVWSSATIAIATETIPSLEEPGNVLLVLESSSTRLTLEVHAVFQSVSSFWSIILKHFVSCVGVGVLSLAWMAH